MYRNDKLLIVVDDSEQIRFALSELLASSGYSVMAFPGGLESIAALTDLAKRGIAPAAAVIDLVMDDILGYEVIAAAKKLFPACPVIAISGGTPNVDPELPLDLAGRRGADVCLRKPFGNAELMLALGSAIKGHRA
ncbi:MAG TPA: response regulator [Stellaceae bacterium]|nr:response regulator [Stellaceae bacterium]